MLENRRITALAVVLAALTACSPDSNSPRQRPLFDEVPLEDPPPPAPGPMAAAYVSVVSTACMSTGDFDDSTTYWIPGCAAADDGFDDETAEFAFPTNWATVFDNQPQNQNIFWVYEIRHSTAGAGRRLVAIGPIGADHRYGTDVFTVKLVKGLEGITVLGYVGSCPSGLELGACRAWSESTLTRHDEPELCIWNPTVAAGGSRDTWCVSQRPEPGMVTNQLPTVGGLASEQGYCSLFVLVQAPDGTLYEECGLITATAAHAQSYSDPDGESLSFNWFIDNVLQESHAPDLAMNGTPSGSYISIAPCSIRLEVRDPRGGVDSAGPLAVACVH